MSNIETQAAPALEPEHYAAMFKALANPHRLRIFLDLASCCRAGEACSPSDRSCVGELGSGLGLAQSTVSHHLKELRQAGLIHMERSGQTIECWVEPLTLQALSGFFNEAAAA
ncbi:MAG TPA: metalloregulator ArsR/SmtB family transcription factor [Alphaproteobacteria bacterium]|jgi:ArsR family transcriptional regulator|nr:metalloregulator ArsR/SmtB family transcription factor [Alphaproteobacteria bacterium]MDP6272317.1 metalloregulator ArsR/SmtB family transcription factor [Alphaproteobacteria bacterium]HJM50530.1 metalloregulator ArsR/SmtB family transcription factor [Alphaproteobacteria bacterium]|tara:strand:+ start:237 stop:575 length:339 start_codon:yes stop_codon:yes gene_type:complete